MHRIFQSIFLAILFLTAPYAGAEDGAIFGRVLNEAGAPEAGVWVIAVTEALPTDYRKIVVTDDTGKFVIPDLPDVAFKLWVRGYGLLDSDPMDASVGSTVELNVPVASDPVDAATVYPATYWLSMINLPTDAALKGNDGPLQTQAQWRSQFKLNCILCHQVGAAATRLPSAQAFDHGFLKSAAMSYFADTLDRKRLLNVLGEWAENMKSGRVPEAPPRPKGVERNFVITEWGWGDMYTYAHDEIASDKRNPTLYPNGRIYGVDLGNDKLLYVDPKTHTAGSIAVPTRDDFNTVWCEQTWKGLNSDTIEPFGFGSLGCPWPGGVTPHLDAYKNPANPHNPMMDDKGRVWMTTQIRRQWAEDAPPFCQKDPLISERRHHRQLGYYDIAKEKFVLVDTCVGTHHLQFDNDGVLWLSGDDYAIGWLDTIAYDPNNPDTLKTAHGYSEVRVDVDGDGKGDEPNVGFHYGIIPNHLDGSVWSAVPPGIASPAGERGRIHRYDRRSDSHEAFTPPAPGYGPRGIDIDNDGIIWTALGGSGHLARFDRTQCKQTWGAGEQCPEGWTLWRTPGPSFANTEDPASSNTDLHYYLWVDRFDTLGMGAGTVIVNGTGSDSLIAFNPKTEAFTVIRIPYPMNTYTRGLDGRIDDPNGGWKGRGLWFTNGIDPIVHSEIPRSYAGFVQMRPNPLAY
ncbi:MAG: hypothetical protein VCB59_11980 [Gammaproteobacteria bacterium]